jgi:hypothetical protein
MRGERTMERWTYAYTTVVGDVNELDRRFQERIHELLRGDADGDENPPGARSWKTSRRSPSSTSTRCSCLTKARWLWTPA